MSRPALLLALSLLAVAGCQPTRPPSPAAQKLIDEQTMIGPLNTKVQARPFTYPVKSVELSLWDIKVFDVKDKDSGLRQEWKHFAPIPQQPVPTTTITSTQILMNGWIISEDGKVFLPQKPTYKAYGSFYTDWTLPKPGDYTLWLEYVPAVAFEDELSAKELVNRKASYNLPREVGHWDFKAVGESLPNTTKFSFSSSLPFTIPVYDSKGQIAPDKVTMDFPEVRAAQKTNLKWEVGESKSPIENPEIVAIAPDNSTLLHGIGTSPELTFTRPGAWKIWFNYTRGEQSFAAPFVLKVAP